MRTRTTRLVALTAALFAPAMPAHAQSWVADFTPSDGVAFDRFGFALEADQDRLLVSSFAAETSPQLQDVGAAYVFEQGLTGWSQVARLDPSDPVSHAQFGRSLGLAGDVAIVGAPHALEQGNETGVVYVFERAGGWVESQRLLGFPWTYFGQFGYAVAIDGNHLVIGAPAADGASPGDGAAFVFRHNGTSWVQVAVLHGSASSTPQSFGWSVAIEGGTVVVGAPKATGHARESGRVYVFDSNGGPWALVQAIEDPVASAIDGLGYSLALSGDELAVGVPFTDEGAENSGVVQLFERSGPAWVHTSTVVCPEPQEDLQFGFQVELAGTLLFSSSPFGASAGPDSGDAWLFGRSGARWLELPSPRKPKLLPLSGFGSAISVGAGYAAFGAWGDSNFDQQSPGQGSASIVSLASVPLHAAFCFGTSCPCGNFHVDGGCRNSTGVGGRLSAEGSLSLREGNLRLAADRLPLDRMAILFVGTSTSWSLAGDGLLCIAGGLTGLRAVGGPLSTGSCGSVDYSWSSLASASMSAGDSRYLQLFYRDPAGPCSQQFNSSNALGLTLVP